MGINYGGGDEFLEKLARNTSIPSKSFKMVQAIGPSLFVDLLREGTLKKAIWTQIVDWMKDSPWDIRDYLEKNAKREDVMNYDVAAIINTRDENDASFASVVYELSVWQIDEMVRNNPNWLEKASKTVKKLIKIVHDYYDDGGAGVESFGYFIDCWLDEAIRVAEEICATTNQERVLSN
ncbi:hypothetical protein IKE98_02150 [Candidatus Saccharibacteria bacterium]|nr:hypothetical protein [Candidatus Saccharibacteria bacterium]